MDSTIGAQDVFQLTRGLLSEVRANIRSEDLIISRQ
jgi:hypothetical protein